MRDQEIVSQYIPLVSFLSNSFGHMFEFVLHDLSNPDGTIIAIKNGHITNRKVGDTLSNLTLRVLKEDNISNEDFRKYQEEALFRNGISSENFIIRNYENEPIGLFCINYSSEFLDNFKYFANSLFENIIDNENKDVKLSNRNLEKKEHSFDSLAESIIDEVIQDSNIDPERMNTEEKLQIVKKLSDKGVFQLKGIIGTVAEKLYVSEATVYRYLSNI